MNNTTTLVTNPIQFKNTGTDPIFGSGVLSRGIHFEHIVGEAISQADKAKIEALKVAANVGSGVELIKIQKTDPFTAALKMAIDNDGKLDKKEIEALKKLEKKSFQAIKKRKKRRSSRMIFHIRFFFGFIPFISFELVPRNTWKQKSRNEAKDIYKNHDLREAFKIAALDGQINKTEITNLKALF